MTDLKKSLHFLSNVLHLRPHYKGKINCRIMSHFGIKIHSIKFQGYSFAFNFGVSVERGKKRNLPRSMQKGT